MNNYWKFGYYVATYILAVVAIAGFVFSIVSSVETARAIEDVQNNLEASAKTLQQTGETFLRMQKELELANEPLLKFNKITWFKNGEITCENPPIGVMAVCTNLSKVPIQIYDIDVKVFYGTKEFNDTIQEIGNPKESIVAPGETISAGTIQKELFQKHLRNKQNPLTPPFLTIQLKADYSRLGAVNRFVYRCTQNIGFDCENNTWQMFPSEETIMELTHEVQNGN